MYYCILNSKHKTNQYYNTYFYIKYFLTPQLTSLAGFNVFKNLLKINIDENNFFTQYVSWNLQVFYFLYYSNNMTKRIVLLSL